MLEIENKYRVADTEAVRLRAIALGAESVETRRDTDHYFNAPDRDFALTDEVLRIRRIGGTNYFTYKGPKRGGSAKSRTEIELEIATAPTAATDSVRLLTFLGYRPVAVVSKTRQILKIERDGFHLEICLDDVGSVGQFVELEILAEESQEQAAQRTLQKLAVELELFNPESRSYLRLLLERPQELIGTPPPRKI